MSGIDDKVQIGSSSDFLEGVSVDTTAGNGLFREGVVVSDPESAEARQRVTNTTPAANDFGAVVRIAGVDVLPISQDLTATDIGIVTHSVIQGLSTVGSGEYHDVKVTPSGALTVEVNNANGPLNVADDYQTGEILPDQTGIGGVLTFTFSTPVQNMWVYAVRPIDLAADGEVRADPFGGAPSATFGIPISLGAITPIPAVATSIKIFAAAGVRVTVYGNRRG